MLIVHSPWKKPALSSSGSCLRILVFPLLGSQSVSDYVRSCSEKKDHFYARIVCFSFHFFKFKFKSWIWAGSVWLVTGQRFGEPWLDLKKKSNSWDSKVFRDRSSKHSYGTSTTFMAYASVPEASDNVASVLFSQKGGRIPRSLQTSSQTMFGGSDVVVS